ncbi:MAG: hypothetical protein LAP38_18035 [Acidobacteriia bacterium]|nr:hypothetical protein [Terriglobia bacterium]
MSRFLEAVFVLGCSLIGFGLSTPGGEAVRSAARYSVRLVSFGHDPAGVNGCYSPRSTSMVLRSSRP